MLKARKMRCTGEKRNTYRVLVCKHEEMRPRHRWKDNIHDLYSPSNSITKLKARKMRCSGEKRNTYRVLVCKHEEMRPRHRWKDNINMTLQR